MIREYTVVEPSTPEELQQQLVEATHESASTTGSALAQIVLELTVRVQKDELAQRRTPGDEHLSMVVDSVHRGDEPYVLGHMKDNEYAVARLETNSSTITSLGKRSLHLTVAEPET